MSFELRVACEADAEVIATLVNLAYRPATGATGWTHEAHLVSGQRTTTEQVIALLQAQSTILLLCTASQIVACVHVQQGLDECACIGMLATAPEMQTQGLGTDMLLQAETYAIGTLKASSLRISVLSARPELLAFYGRRGYVLTGETHEYPASAGIGTPTVEDMQVLSLVKPLDSLVAAG